MSLAVSITCADPSSLTNADLSDSAGAGQTQSAYASNAIVVSVDDPTLDVGQTTTARATLNDSRLKYWQSKGRRVIWTSSDTSIATVGRYSGSVTGVRSGSAKVTASMASANGSAAVSVGQVAAVPVASISVTLSASTLSVGSSATASAVLRDASGNALSGRAISWSSSNSSVATVNASGAVTAVAAGTVNITATSEGKTGSAALTVAQASVPVASVTVSLAASSLQVGQTTTATAVLRDAANVVLTGRGISWSSSNSSVATVNASGAVTAVAVGTANITASSEGKTGSTALTVIAPPAPPSGGTGAIVFASDWSTATGNNATAVRDGTKWDGAYNIASPTADRVSVVPASGLGFPTGMANALAVRYEENTSTWSGVTKQNGWTVPPIGGVLARRMYFRMSMDGTSAGNHHPVQAAYQAGSCPYAAEWMMSKGSTFNFAIANLNNGGGTNFHMWQTTLTRDATYRVEELYTRVSTTTWKLHLRVYDASGALIRQDADFQDTYHNGATLAGQADIEIPDPTCLQHMMIVNQGVGGSGRGSDNPAANRVYYGGFAISTTGWVGPYVPGEGR